ncbi:MAG: hypothetical protein U9R60_00360, partial [Bacteroidota bacterium]|nr:hypothetical protein [Bacteroidota bacterium]
MKIIDLLVKRFLLLIVVLILAVNARSQHLSFVENIKVSPDGSTNDLVIDIIEAGGNIFVYSAKSILVYSSSNYQLIHQIDLPGEFGKFRPVFLNYKAHIGDPQLMTYSTDNGYIYAVTPDIKIIAINTVDYSHTYLVDAIPDSISHFKVLNGFSILKYDASHDRLYWLVEGRSNQLNLAGNFHTRDTYLALYEINSQGNDATLVHEYFDEGFEENYNNTISDVEFTSSNYFFVARKKHIDVYDFTNPEDIYITHQTVPGKFGKLMYEPSIEKIIALPYRLPFDCGGTCEPPWETQVGFYVIDAEDPNLFYSVLAPSKRITDGYFMNLAGTQKLILCYANDAHVQSAVTGPSDAAIYNYNDINDTFQFEYSLETNGIPSGLYNTHFELNRPLKVCRDVSTDNGVIISKVHEVTSLISNQGNPYTDSQVIRGDGNVFYKGIGAGSNNYLLNLACSGIEILNNQTVSNSIQTGSTVYNIIANPIGRKLYLFNKYHPYNSNLFMYD